MISQEYIATITIVIVSLLRVFHIDVASDVITSIIVGVLALWAAIRRHGKGDITIAGTKKY